MQLEYHIVTSSDINLETALRSLDAKVNGHTRQGWSIVGNHQTHFDSGRCRYVCSQTVLRYVPIPENAP